MNESLAVGWCFPGSVDGYFMQSVTTLLMADDERRLKGEKTRILRNGGLIGLQSGPRIAQARNDLVRGFLGTQAEWLLMVDSDVVFSPEDVDNLFVAADKDSPIIGGLYFGCGANGIMFPQMFRLVKPEENNGNPVQKIMDYPDFGKVEVDATGAGFLLMHRSVLEKMEQKFGQPYPWFAEGTVYHGSSFGEDWAFCIRAKSMDIPIYVHTGVKLGHVKSQVMDEHAYKRFRELQTQIGDEGIQAHFSEKLGTEKV